LKKLRIHEPFVLESGEVLPHLEITYHTFGTLNADGSNVVWVCHALTGNSNPTEWWPGIVGNGKAIDPAENFIVCANTLGSCYGTTGPTSRNPETGQLYGDDFPFITIRDMVQANRLLQFNLGIEKIQLGIGGSMGGQELIEWAIIDKEIFENICLLATNAQHSPWGIAFNETQRMAIKADLSLNKGKEGAGRKGLETARAIAMLSYRTYQTYEDSQGEYSGDIVDNFKASSYQRYQGEKFWNRFDVYCYLRLSTAMDSHNVGRGRGGTEKALQSVEARTLILGISSDVLFPIKEQELMGNAIPNAKFEVIKSNYGHDGFLIEEEVVAEKLRIFRNAKSKLNGRTTLNGNNRLELASNPLHGWALPGTEDF
jgi:homoserine O-acetyltransferase